MFPSQAIFQCYPCYLILSNFIIPCYHPSLSSYVIISCYHSLFSSRIIITWIRSLDIIPLYPPSHVIFPCSHLMLYCTIHASGAFYYTVQYDTIQFRLWLNKNCVAASDFGYRFATFRNKTTTFISFLSHT
jgi:hypothetical protein